MEAEGDSGRDYLLCLSAVFVEGADVVGAGERLKAF